MARTILTYKGDIPGPVKKRLEKVEISAAWVILFNTAQELQAIRNTYPPQEAPLSNTRIQFSDENSGGVEISDKTPASPGEELQVATKGSVGDNDTGSEEL